MMGDLDLASSGSTVGVPKAIRDCHRAPSPAAPRPGWIHRPVPQSAAFLYSNRDPQQLHSSQINSGIVICQLEQHSRSSAFQLCRLVGIFGR